MSRYSTVLFDLDGTLRASLPEGFEAFVEYAGRIGIALTAEQLRICEREAHRYWAGDRADMDRARYDQREFWVKYNQFLLDAMGVSDCSDCADRINDLFDEYDPVDVVFADTRPVLKKLRADGYTVGLVSNRAEPLGPLVEQYGLTDLFNFTLSAGEAGCLKPDPGIFHLGLKMAGGTPPSKAIYVGDNYYADVLGAKAAGMDVILVDLRGVFIDHHATRVRHLRDILPIISGAV